MFKKKRKCSGRTRKFISVEKKRVMSETLEYLKELKTILNQKEIA